MKVSVIICTYSMDRLKDTLEVINSIYRQTYPNIEIIVSVDNNKEVLEKLKKVIPSSVRLAFNNQKKGLSRNRNAGIKKATGEIIAFIDDDAIADDGWVETLIGNYSDPEVMAVGGKLIPLWERVRPWWFPEELDWIIGCTYKGFPQVEANVRNLIGCNMSFRKEVVEKIGYFSSNIGRLNRILLSGEETEYCLRISKIIHGAKIIYNPEAVVYHKVATERESLSYVIKRSYFEGISKKLIKKTIPCNNMMKSENSYLKHVILNSLPEYLRRTVCLQSPLENATKAITIIWVIIITGIGYVKGA